MQYVNEHTRAWSRRVDAASAFVFVTPEYNHGYNAALKNAIDYLRHEWAARPVGFVSYGGPAGGVRAVEQLTQVVTALRMTPTFGSLLIPNVHRHVEGGVFASGPDLDASVTRMIDELATLERGLRELRAAALASRPVPDTAPNRSARTPMSDQPDKAPNRNRSSVSAILTVNERR
jgi:NAD(P)H-dependent FMN reductase